MFRFECVYARTLLEGQALLFSKPWREVWWDYDLGLTKDSDNAYSLAVEVERLAHKGTLLPIGRMVVHTANPYGGDRLMAAFSPWYDTVRVSANDYITADSERLEWIGPR
jgi:hypothetical protein